MCGSIQTRDIAAVIWEIEGMRSVLAPLFIYLGGFVVAFPDAARWLVTIAVATWLWQSFADSELTELHILSSARRHF